MMLNVSCVIVLLVTFCFPIEVTVARKHKLILHEDERPHIDLSTFGFVRNGYLIVNVTDMVIDHREIDEDTVTKFGFTLDKSQTNGASPLLDDQLNECRLNRSSWNSGNISVVYMILDVRNKLLIFDRSTNDLKYINISSEYANETLNRYGNISVAQRPSLVTNISVITNSRSLSFHFVVRITTEQEEGLYNFIFHNCMKIKVNATIYMEESNPDNYLSVGQQPLPTLYFAFCSVYFAAGCFWLWIIYSSQQGVFKIHHLMLALMFIKALAMLSHGVNFYFISVEGHEEEAFAVLYYIMYLVKGIFMFVTIVLIGAGWTFVKHILSDRDKKIFVVIIPLQILANVATIIVEESDEGMSYYLTIKNVFIIVDLICCGAILFPVIWSIRHLQQASQTDGKAAINLEKLKIFRHFYILVVCYIYFTRIIVLLVRIAVHFRYEWLDELFVELATFAFFVLTGHKFRPASKNPYLQLPQSDDEDDREEILTRSGVYEMVAKVNWKTTEIDDENCVVQQRESSHEYD